MIEYNKGRKLWHAGGSLFMVGFYLSWISVNNLTFVLIFGWAIAVFAVSVDLIRLNSSHYAQVIKRLPLFGSWLRSHEEKSFNSATYFVVGACLIVTARWLGFGNDRLICSAVLIAGIADPVAATIRYWLSTKPRLSSEKAGLMVFIAIAWPTLVLVGQVNLLLSLAIAIIIALVETFTPLGYIHYRIIVKPYIKQRYLHLLIDRLYPDDNLLIPLLVFGLGTIAIHL